MKLFLYDIRGKFVHLFGKMSSFVLLTMRKFLPHLREKKLEVFAYNEDILLQHLCAQVHISFGLPY